MEKTFKAFYVTETGEQQFETAVVQRSFEDLPEGEVLIRVSYSGLNYKDALSASGNKGVTRNYPHTPGIDAAGVVEASESEEINEGDQVLVTGFDLGMNTDGGFAEYIRVPASWVIPLPDGLSMKECMIYGTAGLTAGLSVYQLIQHGVQPDDGKVLVTGASGGVGSLAVAILAKLGYEVVAVSGKPEAHELLKSLGAAECVDRSAVDIDSKRPLLKPQYVGAVDTVGGNILATILKSLHYNGVATCCGLVNSSSLPTTVFPFILKGVSLIGIDSVQCEIGLRKSIWEKLGGDWKVDYNGSVVQEIGLEELPEKVGMILKGKILGRILVKL